ncbi:MAG TPA: sigma-70 family RNA polymerase sigma factor [Streptosporangiaceae bacterium]|jgi:RNA polymerase sigma-70 factor (ECF subfamily)|nr:sigma-70 family RNA polymerase sigma factor [Streptosporangiaceae bacterium]
MAIDGQTTLDQVTVSTVFADTVFGGLDRPEYERLTRELTGYCYRMLGSPFDAEDAVQDTMMRAWREHGRFEGRSSLRTWLYRIATNVCIDMLRSRGRRSVPMDLEPPSTLDGLHVPSPESERKWVLPAPDAWLEADPAQRVISAESVRLAFVAALQRLTPRQRAVLILRDVLQFSAAESAELLGTTVASANSALQRARIAMPTAESPGLGHLASDGNDADQALLEEYVTAFEAYDISRLTTLLRADAIQSMPPFAMWLRGRENIGQFMLGPGAECRGSRLLPVRANGCAAFAQYRSDHAGGHAPWGIQVIQTQDGQLSALHVFVLMPELFTLFGLPAKL